MFKSLCENFGQRIVIERDRVVERFLWEMERRRGRPKEAFSRVFFIAAAMVRLPEEMKKTDINVTKTQVFHLRGQS